MRIASEHRVQSVSQSRTSVAHRRRSKTALDRLSLTTVNSVFWTLIHSSIEKRKHKKSSCFLERNGEFAV